MYQKTKKKLWISFLCLIVICIVIFVLLWDVNGVWIAFIVSEAVGLLAAALMYRGVKRNMDKGGAAPALCK